MPGIHLISASPPSVLTLNRNSALRDIVHQHCMVRFLDMRSIWIRSISSSSSSAMRCNRALVPRFMESTSRVRVTFPRAALHVKCQGYTEFLFVKMKELLWVSQAYTIKIGIIADLLNLWGPKPDVLHANADFLQQSACLGSKCRFELLFAVWMTTLTRPGNELGVPLHGSLRAYAVAGVFTSGFSVFRRHDTKGR